MVKETDAKKKGKKKLYITISQFTSSQNPKYKTIRKKINDSINHWDLDLTKIDNKIETFKQLINRSIKKLPNTSKFIEFATARENDKGNFSITENRQFISFLEQTISSF